MIELAVIRTSKRAGRGHDYTCYDTYTRTFETLQEARAYLRDTYGSCKRQPMYIDTPRGTRQVGWVYGFRHKAYESETSHTSYLQDWVTFYETCRTMINPNRKA